MNFVQWRCGELEFRDAKAAHTIPSGIEGIFTAPSGRTIRREAFWDGEDCWKIRFAPTELGAWTYTVSGLSSGETSGTLTCVPYEGDLPLYRHGFLKVGPRGKYLCHDDNTPFFWLGDTHWQFAVLERWNESNDPRFDSQFRAIVDRRFQQKFNVYQCNFHCEMDGGRMSGGVRYFRETENGLEPNLDFLKNDLDQKMAYLADHGFCIAAGFTWFFGVLLPGGRDFYRAAARYLIARYGAYPMIWTLAGEVGGYSAAQRNDLIDGWREVALEIEQRDGYHHLQTAHYTNERPFAEYYQEESWFDFTMNQAGHGDYPIDSRPYREHRKKHPSKPFIESESLYENVLTLECNGRRRATPAMLRRVAYLTLQNGGCGYTYGVQGMWHIQWDEPDLSQPDLGFGSCEPWYRGIDYPGADQMTYFREFYESIGWHRLSPLDPSCFATDTEGAVVVTFSDEDLQALFMPSVSADEDMKTIVAYYAETNRYQLGLRTLIQPRYKAQWFFPADGTYQLISEDIRPQNGVWFAPVKPCAEDAVLLLTAEDC